MLVVAAAVLLGLGAGVAVLLLGRDRVTPVAQDRLGPVLLVAGYGGDLASLDPVALTLRQAGRTVVPVPVAGTGTGDLRAQARSLERTADAAIAAGAPSVDVVGYSAGGVVARLWVRDLGGDSQARRVLTLGSPHHGTDVAAVLADNPAGCPAACRQLVPDSDLLRALNSGDETPPGPVFVSVYTRVDRTVTPPDSAVLAGALSFAVQQVCPAEAPSHAALPGDPVVLATLASALGTGPARRPDLGPGTATPCPST